MSQSEPDAPEQRERADALQAMREEARESNDLHFAITEFEQAQGLLHEHLTLMIDVRLRTLPDEQYDARLAEDIVMAQEVAHVVNRRAQILIDLARKLTEPNLQRTRA